MGSGDVFLLLGFGLHLAVVVAFFSAASAENDAASSNYCVNIVAFAHNCGLWLVDVKSINGGTGVRR